MTTLEERVQTLEEKIARLEKPEQSTPVVAPNAPWWERRFGAFRDGPHYESAMRRGKEYRNAQPNPVDNPDAVTF